MIWPVIRRRPRPQRVFQLAVAPLHHPIATWVKSSGGDVLDVQPLAQRLPDRRRVLGAVVRGDDRWHTKAADPAGDQGIRYRRRLHVLDWNGFHPSGRPVNDGEEVLEPLHRGREQSHQIYMEMSEPLLWHWDTLCHRHQLPCHLPPLAGLAVPALSGHV
jgi:hypothetical protein